MNGHWPPSSTYAMCMLFLGFACRFGVVLGFGVRFWRRGPHIKIILFAGAVISPGKQDLAIGVGQSVH
jgi:hypothetical protein